MYKMITIEISYYELKSLMSLKGKFWHERNMPTPTGIKAILEGFYHDEKEISVNEAKEIILSKLVDLGEIEDVKGWHIVFEANHSWSSFDNEGYAHSIYSVDTIVRKSIK